MEVSTVKCTRCKVEKPQTDFSMKKLKGNEVLKKYCNACLTSSKTYRDKRKEPRNVVRIKIHKLNDEEKKELDCQQLSYSD